jgi:hypothetical protein
MRTRRVETELPVGEEASSADPSSELLCDVVLAFLKRRPIVKEDEIYAS